MFHAPENNRVLTGKFATTEKDGPNGIFFFPIKKKVPGFNRFISTGWLQVVAANGQGWEHVSICVTTQDKKEFQKRCPSWEECCFVKDQFWDKEDTCVQFHPDDKNYVNIHPFVLHIWRKAGVVYELPSKIMV
jgi:hypothetical protein